MEDVLNMVVVWFANVFPAFWTPAYARRSRGCSERRMQVISEKTNVIYMQFVARKCYGHLYKQCMF